MRLRAYKSILSILLLFFIAACGDDSSQNQVRFLKKETTTSNSGVAVRTFEYDGANLTYIREDNGFYTRYYYTDGKISRIEGYLDGELNSYTDLHYTDNMLTSFILYSAFQAERTEVIYNSETSVTLKKFSGDHETQESPTGSIYFELEDENVVRYERTLYNYYSVYTYDNKRGPYLNVAGRRELLFLNGIGANNIIKEQQFYEADNTLKSETVRTIKYNASGFPVNVKVYKSGDPETILYESDFEY